MRIKWQSRGVKNVLQMIEGVRWVTQRVTMLLVVPIIFFFVPFVLARLLGMSGFWDETDKLFEQGMYVAFWVAFVFTRLIFGVAWFMACLYLINAGAKTRFFWFDPSVETSDSNSNSSEKKPTIDQSGNIAIAGIVVLVTVVLSEIAIRVYTTTPPVYLLE